jgi:hypothetical protein
VIVEDSRAGADRQHIVQFMTTEHFTLQTARAVINAEVSARLQLYLGTVSSVIIALALVAQLSELGVAFRGFALVLLPVAYFLGVVTHERLLQAEVEWLTYGQGMSRIRHWYLEVAPEMEPYFVLPASDDPRAGLAAVGIGGARTRGWWLGWPGWLSAPAMIVVVNSVLAGVFAGLLWRSVAGPAGATLPAVSAAAGFVLSVVVLGTHEHRAFGRQLAALPVAFPTSPHQTSSRADRGSKD